MAINVDLVADASKAIRESGKLGDALDDVADQLEDVGKTGQSIDDKVQDAFRGMADEAKAAGKTMGDSVRDGTDRAGEGLDNLKDEAGGTAREAAASFASIEDAGGALQEVLANAFVGFGPAGMAAGIVAAAGVGLAISALTDHADKVNENKERMLGLAQTIRDNGGTLRDEDYIAAMEDYGYAIQDAKEWFEIFQADAVSGFDKIRELTDKTGESARDIFKGGFGDKDQAEEQLEDVRDKLEALREKKEAVFQTTGSLLEPVDEEAIGSLEELEGMIVDNIQAQEDATAVEKLRQEAIRGSTEAIHEDIAALAEQSEAVRGAESAELDYLDGIEALNGKLKENGATLDVNTAKGRENRRAVLDQAAAIEQVAKDSLEAGAGVQGVTTKFSAQRDALVNQVMPAFGGSRAKAREYIDTILQTPKTTITNVQLNGIADAEAKLRAFVNQPRSIPVHITPDGQHAVQNYITNLSGQKVYVDMVPRGGGRGIN